MRRVGQEVSIRWCVIPRKTRGIRLRWWNYQLFHLLRLGLRCRISLCPLMWRICHKLAYRSLISPLEHLVSPIPLHCNPIVFSYTYEVFSSIEKCTFYGADHSQCQVIGFNWVFKMVLSYRIRIFVKKEHYLPITWKSATILNKNVGESNFQYVPLSIFSGNW